MTPTKPIQPERICETYAQTFPNNLPNEKDLNHPLLHDIGQPHKTKMLSLFFAVALNLPEDEIELIKQDAEQSLTKAFNAITDKNDVQKTAIGVVLGKKNRWIKSMRLFLKNAGAYKETSEPLEQIALN